ncbi:hypothetical protein N431DRAFT_323190 [Stipitochalara longipes BDJ]|nr:hypothetical protein N431DRAFT_323190 [Stipitochalara longipes BDJ]
MGPNRTRFGNSWCEEFSSLRKINDKQRLIKIMREHDVDGDDLRIFFIDFGNTAAPLEIEVGESFCRHTSLEYVKKGKGLAGGRRTAWLDDRNSPDLEGSGETREYENPLTATGLLQALEPQQFNHENLPDAARRLIYVSDLNPDCIHALVATASLLHACALRSAICRHLIFGPSVAVEIPTQGCLKFHLEFHLPLFILGKSAPPDTTNITVKTKPDRGWIDLSFLELGTPDCNVHSQEPNEVWSLQEAQISCVVSGTDDWRWTAYGFVDAEVDGLLFDATEEEMGFDLLAGTRCELEAKCPIWRPRDYWVRVFENRINQITRHYEYLLYKLNMKVHPVTLSLRPATSQSQTVEMKLAFDWALKMMGLLQKLRIVLLATVETWRAFNSEGGDIDYFCDDLDEDATKNKIDAYATRRRSIRNIQRRFCELGEYQRNIVALNEKCSDYKKAVSYLTTATWATKFKNFC